MNIFCGGLSRSFAEGCQDDLWWVVKIFFGGLSRSFVVGCQDVFYWVVNVKVFCGWLSRCSVVGCQDVLTAVPTPKREDKKNFLPRDGNFVPCSTVC